MAISTLFSYFMPPPESLNAGKECSFSWCTSNKVDAHRLNKYERQQTYVDQKASIVDEELRQQWAREVDVGPFARVITTYDAERVDKRTTNSAGIIYGSSIDVFPSVDRAGPRKKDPLAS